MGLLASEGTDSHAEDAMGGACRFTVFGFSAIIDFDSSRLRSCVEGLIKDQLISTIQKGFVVNNSSSRRVH